MKDAELHSGGENVSENKWTLSAIKLLSNKCFQRGKKSGPMPKAQSHNARTHPSRLSPTLHTFSSIHVFYHHLSVLLSKGWCPTNTICMFLKLFESRTRFPRVCNLSFRAEKYIIQFNIPVLHFKRATDHKTWQHKAVLVFSAFTKSLLSASKLHLYNCLFCTYLIYSIVYTPYSYHTSRCLFCI